jgi:hypothetical protein
LSVAEVVHHQVALTLMAAAVVDQLAPEQAQLLPIAQGEGVLHQLAVQQPPQRLFVQLRQLLDVRSKVVTVRDIQRLPMKAAAAAVVDSLAVAAAIVMAPNLTAAAAEAPDTSILLVSQTLQPK